MSARRLVSFANSTVAIEHQGQQAAEVVDFLYRDIPPGSEPPAVTYCLSSTATGALKLERDGLRLYEGADTGYIAELLMGDSCRSLAERSEGGLLFHAAAVARQGQGLLLPGAIAAGKTTLAAWLLTRGFDHLTDEIVYIPHGATTIQGFGRPLNIKKAAWTALRPYIADEQAESRLDSADSYLLPPQALGARAIAEPLPLAAILFPRYQAESELVFEAVSPARAGLMLMETLVNARNLPGRGFGEVVRLCRATPAYALRYSHFEQIGRRIERLLDAKM